MQFLFFGGIAVVVLTVWGLQALAARKRREAWAALAPIVGLEFEGEVPLSSDYPGFKLFSQGRSQRALSLLRGASGRVKVMLADYEYVTGSGKSRTTHHHTVCVLERDGLDLPHCYLRPQHFLDALGKLFGGQDIDFAEDPQFSKAYVLQGESESAIRRQFDQPTRAWLAARASTQLRFEAQGRTIVFMGPRMAPAKAPQFLDDALSFLMVWG